MGDPKRIVVFDNVSSIRSRIRGLAEKMNCHVHEASNPVEFMNVMAEMDYQPGLVIMDINFSEDGGFRVLKKVKEKNRDLPVIILTSDNKKQTFLRGMVEGASDYILKPFEDEFIVERIIKFLNTAQINHTTEKVSVSIHGYIGSELKKALKGKYNVTLSFTVFFKPVREITSELDKEYIQLSELVQTSLNSAVWETDFFEKYGSQSFIGIFPFCSQENSKIVGKKFLQRFHALQSEYAVLSEYQLVNVFVTYPNECTTVEEALTRLSERIKSKMTEAKFNSYP